MTILLTLGIGSISHSYEFCSEWSDSGYVPHLGTNQKSQKCHAPADLGRVACSALILGKVSFSQSKAMGDSPEGNQGTTTKGREINVRY